MSAAPQPPAPPGRTTRPDSVVSQLTELVDALGLRAGERLPAERELAQQLQVTRGDVRKAIGYLAALGMLEVRHGVGAFLASHPGTLGTAPLELLRAMGSFAPWQMFEARRTLEAELASLAAQRSTPGDLLSLKREMEGMAATLNEPGPFLIHDVRFHRAIAQAAGNPILSALMEVVAGALYKERQGTAGTLANRQNALHCHRAILEAIQAQDATAARTAMQEHLKSAEDDADTQ